MKIAVITSVHPPLDSRIWYKEIVSLCKFGFEVTYIAPNGKGIAEAARKLNVSFIPLPDVAARSERPKRWKAIWCMLKNTRGKFDAWHFHDPELLPILVANRAIYSRESALIYDMHEHYPIVTRTNRYWVHPRLRNVLSTCVALLEGRAMKSCDMVLTATRVLANYAGKHCKNVHVIRNLPDVGGDSQFAQSPVQRNRDVCDLIYTGAISRERGLDVMMEAMRLIGDTDVKLRIIGGFASESAEQDARVRAPKNVTILGKVPFSDVRLQLDRSDIGLVILQPTPAYAETAIPVKLFEYMAAGLPVIASDFELIREIVEDADCGLLVDPTSPEVLANAIMTLIRDQNSCRQMGLNGRKSIETKYQWRFEEKRLAQAYETLM
jgi:glycosyltransferase involved in cell wall biosynthesis